MIADWNPLVNQEISIDGEHGLSEDYLESLEFESGKERAYLKHSSVPAEYPSLSLMLNNTEPTESGKTEYREFENWFNVSLRYGTLPFYFPKIRKSETGIYKFLPNSLKFDRLDGIVMATFGWKEQR